MLFLSGAGFHPRILVLSPHSDDAELGCGGFLAREVLRSHVSVVLVNCKSDHMLHSKQDVCAATRRAEFVESMDKLGVQDWRVMYYETDPDFDLPSVPKQKTISRLDAYLPEFDPDVLLLPVPSFHQDHQYVFECGLAAARPTKNDDTPSLIMAYEYPAANWGPSSGFDMSRGAVYAELTEEMLEKKVAALECHRSQFYRREGGLISVEAVRSLARFRGLEAGCEYAELFHVLRARI